MLRLVLPVFISFIALHSTYGQALKTLCDSYSEPHVYAKSSCFIQFPGPIIYHQAHIACSSITNGHLAFVQTAALFEKIVANISFPGLGSWIGASAGTSSVGIWKWVQKGVGSESSSWRMHTPKWAEHHPNISDIYSRGIIISNGLESSLVNISDTQRGYLCQIDGKRLGIFREQEKDVRLTQSFKQSNEGSVYKCGKKCMDYGVCAGFSYNSATNDCLLADTDAVDGQTESATGYTTHGFE